MGSVKLVIKIDSIIKIKLKQKEENKEDLFIGVYLVIYKMNFTILL